MRIHHIAIVVLISLLVPLAWAGDEPIVTTDLLKIQRVTSIDVSRDGAQAVYSVQSIATENDGEYANRSHLYRVDLLARNATPVQLTFGERNDGSPRISPDGTELAFTRDGQIWLMSLESPGEARQLTDFDTKAGNPVWSPDGNRLLVSAPLSLDQLDITPEWPAERPGRVWDDARLDEEDDDEERDVEGDDDFTPRPDGTRAEIRAWLAKNASDRDPVVINRANFQGEHALQEPYSFAHFFLVDADIEESVAREDAQQVTSGAIDHNQPAFMPDGGSIVYTRRKPAAQHPDRVLDSELWMIDLDTRESRVLVSIDGWTVRSPEPNQDGASVAFIGSRTDRDRMFQQSRIGLANARADAGTPNEPIWLTDTLDRSVQQFEWIPARDTLVFTVADQGEVPLYQINTRLLRPARLIDSASDEGAIAFSAGGGSVVYAATAPANPCKLFLHNANGVRELADLNPWVADKRLSMPKGGWIERPDGTRMQYWIMAPANLEEGATYPLALEIHGGPSAMWGPGEFTMWHEFQLLCSWGYGVVYSNPRGSGGYGFDFERGNYQNWGEGPANDVLAAVDRALQEPWVDPDRLVVTGGSYAGYLTAWIVAHDHRFKAAVAQRGVYELTTFFGEGNAWRLVEWAMGGWPWESHIRPILQRESPFTYVPRIRTPLLIMHASNDLRTGVSQSEMLYRALKVLNKPVEYVRYPDAGHDLSRSGDPTQRMDRLNRIIEFFERFIENERAAPVIDDDSEDSEA